MKRIIFIFLKKLLNAINIVYVANFALAVFVIYLLKAGFEHHVLNFKALDSGMLLILGAFASLVVSYINVCHVIPEFIGHWFEGWNRKK